VPNTWGIVKRPLHVKVRAQDRFGNEFIREGEGLTARAFCHEVDHLFGTLFVDICQKILTPEELDELYAEQETGDAKADTDRMEENL
jgi:peptide deformylase